MPKDEFAHEDPMQIVGLVVPELTDEDIRLMTEGLIDEYVRMGWEDGDILALFADPYYQMTHRIYRERGESYVRLVLAQVRERWGRVWRFRVEEAPVEDERTANGDIIPLESVSRFGER